MPWKVFENDGQYCVHKLNTDKSKGERVGCHESEASANAQLRALYASEGSKELGVISNAINKIKGLFADIVPKQEQSPLLLTKDKNGRLRYLVRYSNNFRDDDYPVRELITENSHRRFDEMVDKGMSKMPELWLWHVPEWKFGESDWHAYDDSGFPMASGLIDEGKEDLAIWVSKQKGFRTSHGMPPSSIVRDPEDPSIIVSHETVEISILPGDRAANKMTGFIILGNESKETGMAIPEEKLQHLEELGVDAELLADIQKLNEAEASAAKESGIESKEAGSVTEEETKPEATEEQVDAVVEEESRELDEEPVAEDADEVANKATGDGPTRDEIAEAVVEAVKPIVEANTELAKEVAQLRKEVSHLKESDDEKIEKAIDESTPASVSALVARRLSVLNSKETEIDGRTSLAKSKPAETEVDTPGHFGIEFIDKMVEAPGYSEESQ